MCTLQRSLTMMSTGKFEYDVYCKNGKEDTRRVPIPELPYDERRLISSNNIAFLFCLLFSSHVSFRQVHQLSFRAFLSCSEEQAIKSNRGALPT
ncbi:hypothetical protein AVEN_135451-1 [Araneus ventricosus]|uniref:Uncharacterized protein n=1 Tax=Araneus ventricosus TaxID=182803 RepID=A0A4Y2BCQ7_ARAVE|nr:hypothetical protein AVEN_135451-1 [Araneus ventricosus]